MLWVKRILIAAVVVFAIAAPINDLGRYTSGVYALDNTTIEAAQQASSAAKTHPTDRTPGGEAAVSYALAHGAKVTGYDQSGGQVTVWTSGNVDGTWVWGPILAVIAGKPYSQWWTTPVVIQDKAQAVIL